MYFLGIDVGGSHITLDLVDTRTFDMLPGSTVREPLDTHVDPSAVLAVFERAIRVCAAKAGAEQVLGVGLAIPGPFDYGQGICRITPQQGKYEQCFGVNFRQTLSNALDTPAKPVVFNNDAACFALGEFFRGGAKGFSRAVVITLGTGFGASFIKNGRPHPGGSDGVPPGGELWNAPYRGTIAEEFVSTRWFIAEWQRRTGQTIAGGKEIAQAALAGDATAQAIYRDFGANLADFIVPHLTAFGADALVIGGNLARDWDLFFPALRAAVPAGIAVKPCELGEQAPICGAALALTLVEAEDVTPAPLPAAFAGFDTLLAHLSAQRTVRLDGPADTPWKDLVAALDQALRAAGKKAVWYDVNAARAGDGFDPGNLANLRPDAQADLCVVVGCGAAQVPWPGAATLTAGA
jgi:predicted NBD/HSP70 family sugar kinase